MRARIWPSYGGGVSGVGDHIAYNNHNYYFNRISYYYTRVIGYCVVVIIVIIITLVVVINMPLVFIIFISIHTKNVHAIKIRTFIQYTRYNNNIYR